MKDFSTYSEAVAELAVYRGKGKWGDIVYPTLGLVGEAGEVAEKVKKILRDKQGVIDDEERRTVGLELGDVLWYIVALANEFDYTLEDIARMNIEKLTSRKARGTIHGNGDDR